MRAALSIYNGVFCRFPLQDILMWRTNQVQFGIGQILDKRPERISQVSTARSLLLSHYSQVLKTCARNC